MRGKGWLQAGAGRWLAVALVTALAMVCQGALSAACVITQIKVSSTGESAVISLLSSPNQPLQLTSFLLEDPPRLVFDADGAALAPGLPSAFEVGAAGIRQARVGQFQKEPSIARLVLDLDPESAQAPPWRVAVGGQPGETLILLGEQGPTRLRPPSRSVVGDMVMLRFAGAAALPRRVAVLEDPPRVYADLTDAELEASYRQEFPEGPVREVRMGQQPGEPDQPVARIVVELREPTGHTVFPDGSDLVFALGPEAWALPPPPYQARGVLKGRRVVVDPGHGGKDVGAPAVPGPPPEAPFEKDIVLDIGLRLAELLKAEGAEVTMTRADDTYVALHRRAAVANDLKADVFVSVHCNSCPTPNTLCGTSVYYDHQHSAILASLVQQELVASLGTADQGVRNANFAVIRRTRGSGILVETAFINHEGDRERLVNPNFRERAARAILEGLIRFLRQGPEGGGTTR